MCDVFTFIAHQHNSLITSILYTMAMYRIFPTFFYQELHIRDSGDLISCFIYKHPRPCDAFLHLYMYILTHNKIYEIFDTLFTETKSHDTLKFGINIHVRIHIHFFQFSVRIFLCLYCREVCIISFDNSILLGVCGALIEASDI